MRCVGMTMTMLLFLAVATTGAGGPVWADDRAASKESPLKKIEPLISAEFCAAVIVQPQRIVKSAAVKPLPVLDLVSLVLRGIRVNADKYRWTFDPAKLRRVVVLIDPFPGGNVAFFPAVVLQFSEDVDGQKLLADSWQDAEKAEFGKQQYYKSEAAAMAKAPMAGYVLGKRMVVLAPEVTLHKMLSAAKKPSPLRKQLGSLEVNHDLTVEFLTGPALQAMSKLTGRPVERLMQEAKQSDQPIEMILGHVKSARATIDFSGPSLLQVAIVATSGESADKLHGLINKGRALAGAAFRDRKESLPDQVGPALAAPLISVMGQMLEGLIIKKEKSGIRVQIGMPRAAEELSKRIGETLKQPDKKLD